MHCRAGLRLGLVATVAALAAVTLAPASRPAQLEIAPTRDANQVAAAIADSGAGVTGAAFVAIPPQGNPAAVSSTPLASFPTQGRSYAILTTGDATLAETPNDSDSNGTADGGDHVRGGSDFDVTILKIDFTAAAGTDCVSFDFRFLSEEFPEFVGQGVNDVFVAELDRSTWTTSSDGTTVSAPDNFAFDPRGNPITVDATGPSTVSAAAAAGTTYDGATPALTARKAIAPGPHSLFLSIFDQGDSVYDSAVFLDRLRVGKAGASGCQAGAGEPTSDSIDPPIDPGLEDKPPVNPEAGTQPLTTSVSNNGSIVLAGGGASGPKAAAADRIACGVRGFLCFGRFPSGSTVTLRAVPAAGFAFRGWTGACTGSRAPTCRVVLSAARNVTAAFAARTGAAVVGATLARPRLSVGWQTSVGRGQLVVSGRITRSARLRIELRRPGGGPLLTKNVRVPAGPFRQVTKLQPGSLVRGAKLLPGGFVVSFRGSSGRLPVPLQLKTVVLASPPEGVVRSSFPSTTETGPPMLGLPAGTHEAWATFVFASQPQDALPLTVSWFNPRGDLVGTVPKPNRPSVVSFVRSSIGLGSGLWRVELRAGTKLVQALSVKIG
jgi:hypothetical protein